MLLPPSVEDYVAADHPVRAIAAYVDLVVDLRAAGFTHASGALGAGQPAYAPADLLKLYLYGYLNRVRSSRRLAAECARNLEVMWLLNGLCPSYHTIADFRKDNAAALKAVNREFMQLCRELGLFGGRLVGIDGSFFNGNASDASVTTKTQLAAQLAAVERDIERYHQELDGNDAGEAAAASAERLSAEQLAALHERAERKRAQLKDLEESGDTQLSRTDPDARRLTKNGKKVTGYNVQVVVDDQHKLILTHAVTNAGNDFGQLAAMAQQAQQALADAPPTVLAGAETPPPPAPAAAPALEVVADAGYFTEADIAACEAQGLTVYVPIPAKHSTARADGRCGGSDFRYDASRDVYICPAGQLLAPTGQPAAKNGVMRQRYSSDPAHCRACPARTACLPEKTPIRQMYRSEHADAVDRHRVRMDQGAEKMRQRAALCEHPFGTLKRWLGWDHFLVRGFAKVRGEMALLVHCYNFRRVLSLFGVAGFIAICRARRHGGGAAEGLGAPLGTLTGLLQGVATALRRVPRVFMLHQRHPPGAPPAPAGAG
jgi:transposase